MDFSLNISNKDSIINSTHHSLTDDDNMQKYHLIFTNNNLCQSSLNDWSPLKQFTGVSYPCHQNMIPLVTTQNLPVYNPPPTEIPSKSLFMGTDSYSNTKSFEESMNNITNNNENYMTYNTSFSLKPNGVFNIFHNFWGNTMWYDTMNNKGLITNIYEPSHNNFVVESQESVKSTTREIIGWGQDEVKIQTNQEKDNKLVRRIKPFKKANTIKWKWTQSEDRELEKLVEVYGTKNWGKIAKKLGGRVGKQCRERWHNHLRPNIKKDAWSEEEDQILIEAHKISGNKWTEIAKKLPGRCENAIKNRWNATKRRIHLMKTKQDDEYSKPPRSNILQSYISHVNVNNEGSKTAGTTRNTKAGDECEMNLSVDVTTQTVEQLVDSSTTSVFVHEPETFTWDSYITELCESVVDPEMIMQGWQ